jgi:hypothetical protein
MLHDKVKCPHGLFGTQETKMTAATVEKKKRRPGQVKRGAAKQNADPNAMITGTKAAWKWIRKRGGPPWPERTFAWHVQQNHVPSLKLGRQYFFWPHELKAHFRLPDDAA